MRNIAMLLSLFLTLAVAKVWAQGKPVCSLLTAGDVSAVGATGQGIPGEMPISNGPTKGDTMKLCSWRLPDGLHVSLAEMPPGMSRDALCGRAQ